MIVARTSRQRLVEWEDPAPLSTAMAEHGGLEMLEEIAAGRLARAPMSVLLDLRIESIAPGRAVVIAAPGEEHLNEMGLVHGGLAAALLDQAMAFALISTLAAADRAAGLDFQIRFLRPLRASAGTARAEGRIIQAGRRIVNAEADLTQAGGGELLARASGCFSVARARDGGARSSS